VESQQTIIPRDNHPANLVGLWTFNDKFAVDHSGKKNLMRPIPKVGPASGNI
jgi:hypothetical protein